MIMFSSLKVKVNVLRQILEEIEDEFKSKGKLLDNYQGEVKSWTRYSSIFFDSEKYAEEKNSLLRAVALEIIDIIHQIFPYVPYERMINKFQMHDIVDQVLRHYHSKYKRVKNEIISVDEHRVEYSTNNIISDLIEFCERLDDPEFIREIQTPLYVALAQIITKQLTNFSREDFPEIKREIFNHAIRLGINLGWIKESEEGYSLLTNAKPKITISCPNSQCMEEISAYEQYCPYCGLYIPNMITKKQKSEIEDVPPFFAIENEKGEWIAYFILKWENLPTITVEYFDSDEESKKKRIVPIYELIFNEVLNIKLAEELNIIHPVPSYEECAEIYSPIFWDITDLDYDPSFTVYKIKVKSMDEFRYKMNLLYSFLRDKAKEYFERYTKHFSAGDLVNFDEEMFINEVLKVFENNVVPSLRKHPILERKSPIERKPRYCNNCGSLIIEPNARFCGICGKKLTT